MLLSRLSRRERYMLYICVAVIAVVFLDKLIFNPVVSKLEHLNKEIVIHERKLEKSTRISKQDDSITKEYEKYGRHIKQISSDEETIAILLSNIEKIAKESSVSFLDVKPSPPEQVGFYKRYVIKIEAEAKINHLVDFIYRLEKAPQLLRVGEFRLSPKAEDSDILKIFIVISQIMII